MTTFAEFKATISEEISRGTSLDSKIAKRVNMAIRWAERRYNMQYMHRFVTFTLGAGDRSISTPTSGVPKRIEFMRIVNSDNEFTYVPKVDPANVISIGTEIHGFWQDAYEFFWFDGAPTEDTNFEMLYFEYAAILVADGDTHWLIDNAEDFMIAQVMKYMSTVGNTAQWQIDYKEMLDTGLQTLDQAEYDIWQGAQDPVMVYAGGTGF